MRLDGGRVRAATLTMLVLGVLVAGCVAMRPVVNPGPWDRYGDRGPLDVFGADAASPGQQVFRALLRERSLEALLGREGEPDTLEVVGGRWKPKQITLTYTRKGAGRARRIVLDPTNDGFIARASEPLATPTPAAKRGRGPAKTRTKATPDPTRTPTAQQQLECPIDGGRADCQALCTGGARHEWCR